MTPIVPIIVFIAMVLSAVAALRATDPRLRDWAHYAACGLFAALLIYVSLT